MNFWLNDEIVGGGVGGVTESARRRRCGTHPGAEAVEAVGAFKVEAEGVQLPEVSRGRDFDAVEQFLRGHLVVARTEDESCFPLPRALQTLSALLRLHVHFHFQFQPLSYNSNRYNFETSPPSSPQLSTFFTSISTSTVHLLHVHLHLHSHATQFLATPRAATSISIRLLVNLDSHPGE